MNRQPTESLALKILQKFRYVFDLFFLQQPRLKNQGVKEEK
jgi:hypothetical protein